MSFCLLTTALLTAATWTNLTPTNHLGGRMVSAGYLRGKTVLVDCRDYGKKECVAPAKELEDIWASLKTKPFVVLASHCGEADPKRIAKIVEKLNLTFAVYDHVGLEDAEVTLTPGKIMVFDLTGKPLYTGDDPRQARGVASAAIMAASCPQTVKEWRHILDYELAWLPGKAYERLQEFRAKFPAEAEGYAEVWASLSSRAEIKKLAKLEQFAHAAKDYDHGAAGTRRMSAENIDAVAEKFAPLKQSADPLVVQEAKNCLADLIWTAAILR